MRKSRFTDEHIHGIVREVEAGGKVLEVCRRHGISKNTLQRWRAKGTVGTAAWNWPRRSASRCSRTRTGA
jgi:putative transposase